MKRTKKPTKPASAYSADEVMDTAIFANLVKTLPSLRESEAIRLTRVEIDARWTDLNRERVNKLVDGFRAKLAALGVVGKTVKIVEVTDKRGNLYYDVTTQPGGRKHGHDELLPKGSIKTSQSKVVTALKN
jgi:hypothetical protein